MVTYILKYSISIGSIFHVDLGWDSYHSSLKLRYYFTQEFRPIGSFLIKLYSIFDIFIVRTQNIFVSELQKWSSLTFTKTVVLKLGKGTGDAIVSAQNIASGQRKSGERSYPGS
uniref:Uncharacterized protein n=1 Tax=Cacopsylla melanoneura TaxID=428564 RepID=A0A8D9A938_9HEMI